MDGAELEPRADAASEWVRGLYSWLETVLPGERFGIWTAKLVVVLVTVAPVSYTHLTLPTTPYV